MTYLQFLRVALECIIDCQKPLAFDKNASMAFGGSPSMQTRAEKYKELEKAAEYARAEIISIKEIKQ